jgi:hypothetical protein
VPPDILSTRKKGTVSDFDSISCDVDYLCSYLVIGLERQSLLKLQATVKLALEVIRLWGILLDHQFQTIVSLSPPEVRNALQCITFGELVENREEVSLVDLLLLLVVRNVML